MFQYFKYLSALSVMVLCLLSCSNQEKPENQKKKLPSNSISIQLTGSNQLDVVFSLALPSKKSKKYEFFIQTNQVGDKKNWKDSTWKSVALDSGLTNFLGVIHDLPFEASRNATYIYKNNGFSLEEEFQGTEVDTALLRMRMKKLIQQKGSSIDLSQADLYVKPKYTKDSEELKAAKRALESCLNATVKYSFEDKGYSLDKRTFGPWLSLDADLKVKVDYISAQTYLQKIAGDIEKPLSEVMEELAKLDPTDTTNQEQFSRVNIPSEVDELIKFISTGKTARKEVVLVKRGLPKGIKEGLTDFVEVSISQQKLWLFKGGSLVLETDVVTGNEKLERNTPIGDYKILFKTRDKVLKGPGYESFVSYWMPFYKGYGLHDATWRRRFGASIYQNGGSHGCVNIPPKMAPIVYQNVVVGMPVLIRQ
jgi:lipoprotein-anchoring transpeptidase ErfK/SrfK